MSLLPLARAASAILRGGDSVSASARVLLIIGCGAAYGAVLGGFGIETPDGWKQSLFSATKVPLLLMVAFVLGLPSFFVLNSLAGLRNDFPAALRALTESQAAVAVALVSLAPFTALWYASSGSYAGAQLFNGAMFALATLAAQVVLRRRYRPLIDRDRKHRTMLVVWLVLYWFVAIQMAWVLRPFIGAPGTPVQFFRTDSWGNAYVILSRGLWGSLVGAESSAVSR
jgi:hypothetical protein